MYWRCNSALRTFQFGGPNQAGSYPVDAWANSESQTCEARVSSRRPLATGAVMSLPPDQAGQPANTVGSNDADYRGLIASGFGHDLLRQIFCKSFDLPAPAGS